MDWRREKGFTLSELMIASLILALTLVSMIGLITNLASVNEANRDLLVATLHAQYVLAEIKENGNPTQVASLVNTGHWDLTTAQLAAAPYSLTTLSGETIDTAVFQSGNPCGVTVTLSWVAHSQRPRSVTLSTLIAD